MWSYLLPWKWMQWTHWGGTLKWAFWQGSKVLVKGSQLPSNKCWLANSIFAVTQSTQTFCTLPFHLLDHICRSPENCPTLCPVIEYRIDSTLTYPFENLSKSVTRVPIVSHELSYTLCWYNRCSHIAASSGSSGTSSIGIRLISKWAVRDRPFNMLNTLGSGSQSLYTKYWVNQLTLQQQ